jgi:hypothetical protein
MKGMTIMLEEKDLQELKATARKMALPPSVYARSLLLRSLRDEVTKLEVKACESRTATWPPKG